ncbi:MAG TPA: PAS domain-containing protein [Nitrospirae bacterium]|nr:sporulation kinase A [bacterium BMS3Abin06]HDH10927.1 PAS domain-containing protein [Nitrospirota bacterium]HDZ00421.1 PAS domain-containing protein [Nitrospirota bacterium]
MEKVIKLNEAFHSFTQASKSLQTYYEKLKERVHYLTGELERKNRQINRAMLEVSESKDYLHAVLQSIGEAMIVLDRAEKITMINTAAEELLCNDSGNVKGMMFNDLDFSIEDSTSGTRLNVSGKKYDIILSRSTVCNPEGSVRGYVILIKDITRLKELERQHERNERLIAMGEMAAKIVHEIRSPLCSIELFSNMLSKDLEGTAHSEMANGISTGIKSLNNILTNMLFFAKPQRPSLRNVNLSEAVEESIKMLTPLIEVRGIKITGEITDVPVCGDVELLKHVFMNVILNAVQSMPEGGNLNVVMGEESGFVTVAVIDEGEGVDPEIIEKIFDPFFSTKDMGTGLGLAIAHKIMQCHKGFIKATGNSGKGSTFCIYFPETEKAMKSEQQNILEKAGKQS